MRFLSALSCLAAAVTALASSNEPRQSPAQCAKVHFFLARGNNEPYPGRQGMLVAGVCDGIASCDYEDLVYSALYTDLYCQSAYDGAIAGHVQMAAYASRCPDAALVLAGYSQGAQIASDILGGAGATLYNGCVQPPVPALSRADRPGSMLKAVLAFGSVRHTAGQPFNYGNGSGHNGQFPRPPDQLANLNRWADIYRDWCVSTDPICAYGQPVFNVKAHLGYFDNQGPEAIAWLRDTLKVAADTTRVLNIPTSISGYAQDYATVPTNAPTGTVKLNTGWEDKTKVVMSGQQTAATTTTTSSSAAASSSSAAPSSSRTSSSSVPSSTTVSGDTTTSASSASSEATTTSPPTSTPVPSPPVAGATTTTTSRSAGDRVNLYDSITAAALLALAVPFMIALVL